jgi:ABC-2 type transport system ATP-binding protein
MSHSNRLSPADPRIRVEHVTKRYGRGSHEVRAVCDVSFDVHAGEVFALLGHNGAGKSTLIRSMATLLRPDAGRILFNGHDISQESCEARRLLGVSLQDTGVPRKQTARRLIWYHARLHGLSRSSARQRAEELLESFDLATVANRVAATYSGGERRRLDLALALVHRPQVILLDEPTAGLDVASRRAVWLVLEAQVERGASLLFSSHDLQEADERAHRIAVVDRGQMVACGAPAVLKRRFSTQLLHMSFPDVHKAQCASTLLGGATIEENETSLAVAVNTSREAINIVRWLEDRDIRAESVSISEPTLTSAFDCLIAPAEEDREPMIGSLS